MIDELEKKYGFKVENLNAEERESFFKMLEDVNKSRMGPEKLREYVISMREAVERELVNEPEFIRVFIFKFDNRKQIFLKARLLNYLLLEAFLVSPERAKAQLEEALSNIGRRMG
ncbi:hypothetical protein CMO96_05065 [Candidatus Woesebacteria bacterium]|nr:hypothetical protein [Candidatus Woesebacteria bacterium]|tara:strand:- start:1066 stop:1410 length:345 start_codon:yes stop_codon:yes gene_type:complete